MRSIVLNWKRAVVVPDGAAEGPKDDENMWGRECEH